MMALKTRAVAGGVVLCAAAWLTPLALAQEAGAPPAEVNAPAQPGERALANAMLADSIARLAIFDLRATIRPGENDYRIASLLLGLARDQRPDDMDLLRRQIEASFSAGDQQKVLELTRELLRLDPGDTVAQLRLITASIATNNQTGEERLAAYEKFLGPEGRRFAPEIRSRLALDAALLLRERGDERGFADRLTQSLQLDPTHKEAAALAVAYYTDRMGDDRAGRLALLQNLLMADPVDPNVHLSIARELVAGGAYEGAQRFFRNALQIIQIGGSAPDEDLGAQSAALVWHVRGPSAVVESLRAQLMNERAEAAKLLRRFEGVQVPPNVPKPEDVRLPVPTALIGVAAAEAAGDADAVRAMYQELARSVSHALTQLQDPEQRARYSPEAVNLAMAQAALQVHRARLWANIDVESVRKDLADTENFRKAMPEQADTLEGWLALRSGDHQAAIDRLRPWADTNPFARIGLALSHERAGRPEEAVDLYRRTLREAPLSTYGAWAASRMRTLGVREEQAGVSALERAAERIPSWIDRMVTSPREFVQMTLTPARTEPGAAVSNPLLITLQNLAPVPLALGSDRALNSRVLLSPQLETQNLPLDRWARPEVADLDRRLRLKPRERLEVVVNPELGVTGWMLEAMGNRTLRVRWRGTQGFVMDRSGGFRPGVMCVSSDSPVTLRRPLPEADLETAEFARASHQGTLQEVPRLAAALRAKMLQPLLSPMQEAQGQSAEERAQADQRRRELAEGLSQVWASRYPSLPPEERAVVAALLPHATLVPGMEAMDQALRQEEHPLPLAVVLATRVKDAGDEVLAKASGSPDPMIRQLSMMIAERLGSEEMVYARMTPDRLRADASAPAAPSAAAPGAAR